MEEKVSELKDWKPKAGGYGETFKKGIQTEFELIDDINIIKECFNK